MKKVEFTLYTLPKQSTRLLILKKNNPKKTNMMIYRKRKKLISKRTKTSKSTLLQRKMTKIVTLVKLKKLEANKRRLLKFKNQKQQVSLNPFLRKLMKITTKCYLPQNLKLRMMPARNSLLLLLKSQNKQYTRSTKKEEKSLQWQHLWSSKSSLITSNVKRRNTRDNNSII